MGNSSFRNPDPRRPNLHNPGVHIRRAILADVPGMVELEKANPAAAQWSRMQYEQQFSKSPAANDFHGPEHFALVAEQASELDLSAEKRIIGFIVASGLETDWELENIVVAAKSRGGGIGTLLLAGFIDHVRTGNGRSIFLEVRESNRNARLLYRNAGFKEEGTRKNYYKDPAESAILYRLSL